ncbi:MAG: diacylglycerol kinase family protein [Patescibacteria group bacterium]|jgi:hypothetical protein
MHVYIFDYFLNQKKYEKIVAKIETRLTDLGLNGKNCHVGPLKSLTSIVRDELKNNPKTVVAIGNNNTLNQIINSLESLPIPVGIIPVGVNNEISRSFGIKDEDEACNILSARLMETIDLGVINGQYFVSSAEIQNKETIIEINNQYTIEPTGPGKIKIINLDIEQKNNKSNPRDGLLELYITVAQGGIITRNINKSFIQSNNIIVNNLIHKNFIIDNSMEIKTPAQIGTAKGKLKIIVGKERIF